MIGRVAKLERVVAAADRARLGPRRPNADGAPVAGSGSDAGGTLESVLVRGEAGIGKPTLVRVSATEEGA